MKYLKSFETKSMNESIDRKKYDSLKGLSPNYKLLDYINELIEEVNNLNKRIKELEK
jgi:hypothetical protein